MRCINCKNTIEDGVEICPYCKTSQKRPFYKRWWFILLVVITLLSIFGSSSEGSNTSKNRASYIVMAENAVEDRLKAPASAVFCNATEYRVAISDNLVLVQGHVDSQNSFGAMLRSEFIVELDVEDVNNFRYRVVYMQIGEYEYYNYIDADWKLLE